MCVQRVSREPRNSEIKNDYEAVQKPDVFEGESGELKSNQGELVVEVAKVAGFGALSSSHAKELSEQGRDNVIACTFLSMFFYTTLPYLQWQTKLAMA